MSEERPVWWRPGMTDREIASWEAAERCAARAPELRRGDAVAIDLERVWLAPFRDHLRQEADAQTKSRPKRSAA